MKKYFISLCSACLSLVLLQSCITNTDNPSTTTPGTPSALSEVVTIENAVYVDAPLPAPTISETISGISANSRAIQGGVDIITINTEKTYTKFFVSVEGVDGHYVYTPEVTRATLNNYIIPLLFDEHQGDDVTVKVSGEDEEGNITQPYEIEITFLETKIGDLNIALQFSNAKDIDLHLYTPSNKHIYFGNRGGSYTTTDGRVVEYGLDIDSNAACNIDNINAENIFLPAELIENGVYTVVVDLWSNCNPSIATYWTITAKYQGALITPITGANPANGVYPIGAGNGDHTRVMTFQISDAAARGASKIITNSFVPTPIDEISVLKALERGWMTE